ncbi:MAG: TetR/AcrR family transcriptional regulator [Actinomycetota bacterium]
MSSNESETRKKILAATWQLMEAGRGHEVRMSDIAEAVGISRQAVYLHFSNRTELMVATTHYVDEVCGLDKRLLEYRSATSGVEILEAFVEFWGNYIPEIYGLAKALLAVYETDEAAATAWNDRMAAVRSGCRNTIDALVRDEKLAPEWSRDEAIDFFWTMLSVQNWELLTKVCGWSGNQYIERMQSLLKSSFVKGFQKKDG